MVEFVSSLLNSGAFLSFFFFLLLLFIVVFFSVQQKGK